MKYILFLFGAVILLGSCQDDPDFSAIDLGYDYFPNEVGTFLEYEVDSISYGIETDTTHFWLREVVAEDFIDDEGNLATRIERYKKFQADDNYTLTDVWVQKRTSTTAERFEENVRYVRLVFPVRVNDTWDGNAYNTEDPWNYTYTQVDGTHQVGTFSFDNALRVQQRENVNLVDQEEAWEVYVRDIGLVHKRLTDLTYQNFQISGVDFQMELVSYGFVE